ncbi:hypothetical protein RE680_12450 [Serratia marcescens]|uniref:hypothetical protein n=1 Tax=Serratia TaxID=613 RepID=UPI0012B84A05|nr:MULTISPECIES: hypothetical protein [Serratia]MTD05557.1 hypothetical protein [Serratia sp. YC16]WMW59377.1 hypothetical protein RE680_12450 [Serratia marcescens]
MRQIAEGDAGRTDGAAVISFHNNGFGVINVNYSQNDNFYAFAPRAAINRYAGRKPLVTQNVLFCMDFFTVNCDLSYRVRRFYVKTGLNA